MHTDLKLFNVFHGVLINLPQSAAEVPDRVPLLHAEIMCSNRISDTNIQHPAASSWRGALLLLDPTWWRGDLLDCCALLLLRPDVAACTRHADLSRGTGSGDGGAWHWQRLWDGSRPKRWECFARPIHHNMQYVTDCLGHLPTGHIRLGNCLQDAKTPPNGIHAGPLAHNMLESLMRVNHVGAMWAINQKPKG